MQYVALGQSDLQVSRLCLGCMSYGSADWRPWVLDENASRPFYRRAIEHGINFFDTADTYSLGMSEEITGRALREFGRRDQFVIATKVFYPTGPGPNERGLSRGHLLHAVDASLKRLGTDFIDLYQIHRWDSETPIEETLRTLDDIVRAGKVRYVGASSMYAWQFAKALTIQGIRGWTKFVSMQNLYNLVYREEERYMLRLCREDGIAVIPWSPLAAGFLAGNRHPGGGDTVRAKTDAFAADLYFREVDFTVAQRGIDLARRRAVSPAQVALAWLLHKEVAAAIIGATRLEHLDESVDALSLTLDDAEIEFLEAAYVTHPVLGHG